MDWKQLLGSITTSVDEELRLRNAYLEVENRILRQQISGRVQLTDSDRKALAEIGQQLGKKALEEIATVAKPNTILAWHRTFMDQLIDSPEPHRPVGRPRVDQELEALVVRMARENRAWGYDRSVGALANLGYVISDQTVGNILKRHGIPPAPERKKTMTWREFIRIHMDVLGATDFFTSKVWVRCGLVIAYLICFIHCGRHPIDAVSMMLSHRARWRVALLPWSRAMHVAVRCCVCWVRATTLSGLIWFDEGILAYTPSAGMPHVHRHLLPQGMGKVMRMPPVKGSQIRDGPRRCHQERSEMLQDNICKAA
jgi:hypothetical protein